MGGTSLAFARRSKTRLFTERVFVGDAIDIGCGDDPIRICDQFPLLRSVREWDKSQGDATLMDHAPRGEFDLVYSSHCLEHLDLPMAAVARWWELVRPGGHLCVVVPDEELYEKNLWPSRFNPDHRHSFSTCIGDSRMPNGVALFALAVLACEGGRIISLVRLEDGFIPGSVHDQTADQSCECGIELVVRKEHQ